MRARPAIAAALALLTAGLGVSFAGQPVGGPDPDSDHDADAAAADADADRGATADSAEVVGRPACRPSVELAGDADVAAAVARALDGLGVVAAEADNACPPVHAQVHPDGVRVAVTVRDAGGRIEGRVVGDAAVAATWIESWTTSADAALWAMPAQPPRRAAGSRSAALRRRHAGDLAPPSTRRLDAAELDPPSTRWRGTAELARPSAHRTRIGKLLRPSRRAALLLPSAQRRHAVEQAPPGAGAPGWSPSAPAAVEAPAASPPGADVRGALPISVVAAVDTAGGDDASSWLGWRVAACRALGPTCTGVGIRRASNQAWSTNSGFTAVDRTSTELIASVAVPVRIARVTIAPTVGAGIGWLDTVRDEDSISCTADGSCGPTIWIGDGFAARTFTPRLEAGVDIAIPLADHVFLELRATGQLAPGAHTGDHVHSYSSTPFDPGGVPFEPGDPFLDLPGEPGRWWTAGVGLRIGAL